jgi:hypothetical protein
LPKRITLELRSFGTNWGVKICGTIARLFKNRGGRYPPDPYAYDRQRLEEASAQSERQREREQREDSGTASRAAADSSAGPSNGREAQATLQLEGNMLSFTGAAKHILFGGGAKFKKVYSSF